MSVSKWAYEPDKCDGHYCCGDCDYCILKGALEMPSDWMVQGDFEVGKVPQYIVYRITTTAGIKANIEVDSTWYDIDAAKERAMMLNEADELEAKEIEDGRRWGE